jgi:hypothetical protein
VLSIRQETQTWDEGIELAGGYSYLTTGDYRVTAQHPPLARILAALPLLAFRPHLPGKEAATDVDAGRAFLYENRTPADELLFAARLPMIAVTAATILALAAWTRRRFGTRAALAAACFFGLDPNVLAHGRYVKHDVPVTFFAFLAAIAWEWYLESKKKRALAAAGVALGLALGTKFSAVFLIPTFAILYAIHEGRGLRWRRAAGAFAATGAMAFATLAAIYAPDAAALVPRTAGMKGARPALHRVVDRSTAVGQALAWTGAHLGLRSHPLLTGVAEFAAHNGQGHESYLMGMHSTTGWWYYYPAAFVVKSPTATLAALALALALGIGRVRAGGLRGIRFSWATLAAPIAVYGAMCCASRVDIGIRLLLPVYPYLCAAIGAALAEWQWRWRTAAMVALAVGLAAETGSVYPHFTAFFNGIVGGPKEGPRRLVDSNIDWGQDLKGLKEYVDARGVRSLCADYFGTAPMEYYGLHARGLPGPEELRKGAPLGCETIAVSVTPLYGVYTPPGYYAWLREVPPRARIGWSIYVWDAEDAGMREAVARARGGR